MLGLGLLYFLRFIIADLVQLSSESTTLIMDRGSIIFLSPPRDEPMAQISCKRYGKDGFKWKEFDFFWKI
jgi:hypothetical protein